MVEGLKSLSDGDGYSGIVVYTRNFGFSRRGYHVSEYLALDKYSAVQFRMLCDVGMVRELKVAGNSAPGFGSYQVSCVSINAENHVAGVEMNVGIWVCLYVVHESLRLFFCFYGWLCLCTGDVVECWKD